MTIVGASIALTCAGTLPNAGSAVPVPQVAVDASADMPDPHVVVADGRYVTFASATGSTGTVRRIPTVTSGDLATFAPGADALPAPANWAATDDLWAPAVALIGGSWRMYYAARSPDRLAHCITVATGDVVTGPFVDISTAPLICDPQGGDAIDPEPFMERGEHGEVRTTWLTWKATAGPGDGRSALWTQPMAPDGLSMVGSPVRLLVREQPWEAPVIESPSMIEWAGTRLLFYSGGTFIDERYAIGYAVCDGPAGPCTRPRGGPLLASGGSLVGPGGQSAFVDLKGHLRLAHHAWVTAVGGASPQRVRALRVAWVVGHPAGLRVVHGPFGAIDDVRVSGGKAVVRGWMIDPNKDGGSVAMATAGGPPMQRTVVVGERRADVEAAYPGWGASVGFTMTIPWNPDSRQACVYSGAVAIGCRGGRAG